MSQFNLLHVKLNHACYLLGQVYNFALLLHILSSFVCDDVPYSSLGILRFSYSVMTAVFIFLFAGQSDLLDDG